jgi:hypothetical protein
VEEAYTCAIQYCSWSQASTGALDMTLKDTRGLLYNLLVLFLWRTLIQRAPVEKKYGVDGLFVSLTII